MPRLPRLHVAGGCYHVVLRGNHREALFEVPADRQALNDIVAEALVDQGARIHAYCWMTNHLHALVQIREYPLGKLMQRIATGYSRYRHRQLRTKGHLFERRYGAWLVDVDAYFLTLLRYIHLNPVKAGMVVNVQDYPWSSHRAYLGEELLPWVTTDFGLSLFANTVVAAQSAYRQFICQASLASEDRALEGRHPDDPRVFGGDRFLASLPAWRILPRSAVTLEELAAQLCELHQVSLESVRSRQRQPLLTMVRVDIARCAVEERIASLNEVARFLGRSHSSLSELLTRYRQ